MSATVLLKPTLSALCSALGREYFWNTTLPQVFIFHTAGGEPALFEWHHGKVQLLHSNLQHGKVGGVEHQVPSQSIHTHTLFRYFILRYFILQIFQYSKLMFSLFLHATVKAEKPLIARADGY